ncbi:TPA: hypothetical protein ACJXXT_000247 [Pseudomonas aeruginosa]|uniref:hypothetical protein n=1 Tax=Pseudomonas putida TaxID=303 RepID=UPI001BAF60CA|nr:hypothetical protein [Pseudomonas putida]QUG90798.1 hypothetical protein GR140_19220 [Pseudomonas putida]
MEFILNIFKTTIVLAVMVAVALALKALTNITLMQIVGGYVAYGVAAVVFAFYEKAYEHFLAVLAACGIGFIVLLFMGGMKII